MKKLLIIAIFSGFALSAFSQAGTTVNKRRVSEKNKVPSASTAYGKQATKQSRKDMNTQAKKFETPKYDIADRNKNAQKERDKTAIRKM